MTGMNKARLIMQNEENFEANISFSANRLRNEERFQDLREEERVDVMQKRLNKFFGSVQHIDVSKEHYRPRIQPFYRQNQEPTRDTLIVFGIDFLETENLKIALSVGDPGFQMVPLDLSNCMLKYSCPEKALQAIRANLWLSSQTSYKVEEGGAAEPAHVPTKKWVQLTPYTYRHQYRANKIAEYSRKWCIRYATFEEKNDKRKNQSKIDQLYETCRAIWTLQAQKHAEMKEIIQQKLQEFNKRREVLRNLEEQMVDQGSSGRQRSRTRDKYSRRKRPNRDLDKSFIASPERPDREKRNRRNRSSESQMFNLNQLSIELDQINKQMEENQGKEDKELTFLIQRIQNLNFDGERPPIKLDYDLAIPQQIRLRNQYNQPDDQPFSYKRYMEKSRHMQERIKHREQIDLTDQ